MTPLERIIRSMIADGDPMPLDHYMALCLAHQTHGYYMTRDPLGAAGDFTTSPEISQTFGELIGIWLAQVWMEAGSPTRFSLVELGPGRGTLMKDILRATHKVKGFHAAADVHFLETSPVLRKAQHDSLPDVSITWHDGLESLPKHHSLIVANEFFDAIPIRQFEQRDGVVSERRVGLHNDVLGLTLVATAQRNPFGGEGVFEVSPARTSIAMALGALINSCGGTALIIDYGHRKSAMGDTLQAMSAHQYCSIFDMPGEADLTSHVDFEALAKGFGAGGAMAWQIMTQGDFLRGMGLDMRAQALSRRLADAERDAFLSGIKRISDDDQMGQLFKVLAVTQTGTSAPYPFGDA